MSDQEFSMIVTSGLLRDVERIVVDAYLAAHPAATRPDAYHWLRYEDPAPMGRLADGVKRLRRRGAEFNPGAVDKTCARASKLGYLN
jgi:hypothetical protein